MTQRLLPSLLLAASSWLLVSHLGSQNLGKEILKKVASPSGGFRIFGYLAGVLIIRGILLLGVYI